MIHSNNSNPQVPDPTELQDGRLAEMSVALQKSEDRYHSLADAMPQLVWITLPNGQMSYCNRRFLEYSGLTLDGLSRQGWKAILHPDDVERYLSWRSESLRTLEEFEIEYRLRRSSDGSYRWHLIRSVAITGQSGAPCYWVGSATDIEDQKRAAESAEFLAEAGRLMASTLDYEASLARIAEIAVPRIADWCVVDTVQPSGASRRVAVVHPDPRKVALAYELQQRYPDPPDAPHGIPYVVRTGQAEIYPEIPQSLLESLAVDNEHLRLLQSLALRSYIIVPMIIDGQVTGTVGFVMAESGRRYGPEDLQLAEELARRAALHIENARLFSEVQDARRTLEEQYAFMDAVARSMGEGLYALDESGLVRYMNPAAERMLGWRLDEILGQNMHDLIHSRNERGEHVPASACPLLRVIRDGVAYHTDEDRFQTKDGALIPVAYISSPLIVDGRIRGAVLAFHDITEQKRNREAILALNESLEARVRQRTRELEDTNRELEAFTYSVSHDLRAPIRHISGFTEMLQRRSGSALDDDSQRYIQVIRDAAGRAGQLVDDLLAFSRMGRAHLQKCRVDMELLVREVCASGERDEEGRAIEWNVERLPLGWGDASMLQLVWQNLISNALKYTRPREIARIQIGATSTPEENVYYVKDNGVGFDMRYIDKLWGVFQRLHSADEFEGTGIGLANVQRIVQRHGGRTWAESSPGAGATFYFSLPCSDENPAANSESTPSQGPEANARLDPISGKSQTDPTR